MKPLRSAPQTREDIAIWDRVVERHDGQGIAYSAASITADRRDAELMFRAQCNRWVAIHPEGYLYDSDPPCLAPMRQECGPTGGALNITPCA